jgi:hypothetical protein
MSFIKPVIVNRLPSVPKNPNCGISIYIIMQIEISEVIKKALWNLRLMVTHNLNLSNNDFSP